MCNELLAKDLADKLSQEENRGRLNGAAGICWTTRTQGPHELTLAFGLADHAAGVSNTPDTRFPIGSLAKLFTATTVLRLWQCGKVELDTPISSFVRGFTPAWADQLTFHHLLSHTSGLPGLFRNQPELQPFFESLDRSLGGPGSAKETASVPRDALWGAILQLPTRTTPGSRFEYSNTGYLLAALVIERLFHKPFSQMVQEQVLVPLGLQNTGSLLGDSLVDVSQTTLEPLSPSIRRAIGHFGTDAAPRIHPTWLLGAGDLESTVADLLAFGRGLEDTSFLGVAARERLLFAPLALPIGHDAERPEENPPNPPLRGYGWRLGEPFGGGSDETRPCGMVWHDGLLPGVLCTLHLCPNEGSAAVLLTNRLPGVRHNRTATRSLHRLARELLHTVSANMSGTKPQSNRATEERLCGRPLLEALCGTYALDLDQRLIIGARADGGFHLRGDGTPPFSLTGITQVVDAAAATLRERVCTLLSALEQDAVYTSAVFSTQKSPKNRALRNQVRNLCQEQRTSPDELCNLWQSLTGPDGFGPLQGFYVLQHEGHHLVACRCHFGTQHRDLHVHFDDDGKVVGFFLHPVGTAPAVCELPLVPDTPGRCLGDGYMEATQDLFLTLQQTHETSVCLLLCGDDENTVLRRAVRVN